MGDMPINMETETGYYDGSGVFHQNTQIFLTPIPGIYTTGPIVQGQPYNPFPDIQPFIPANVITNAQAAITQPFNGIGQFIQDTTRGAAAAGNAFALSQVAIPILALVAVVAWGKK